MERIKTKVRYPSSYRTGIPQKTDVAQRYGISMERDTYQDGLSFPHTTRHLWRNTYKHQYPDDYVRYKLSIQQAAELVHVHPDTVRSWIRAGRLNSRLFRGKDGNLIRKYRRISLKDLANCIEQNDVSYHEIENTTWTPQEIVDLKHGIRPEYRSRQACRNMKHRLRRKGEL